jgi:hypothetical protein
MLNTVNLPQQFANEFDVRFFERLATFEGYEDVFQDISSQSEFTWETIKNHPELPWTEATSSNTSVTWEIVMANPEYPWSYTNMCLNRNITWDIICANRDKFTEDVWITYNPNITWEIVDENPNIAWDWKHICLNFSIPRVSLYSLKYFGKNNKCRWKYLSGNLDITWETVMEFHDRPWDWDLLSSNPDITWEIVKNNPNHPWNSARLCANPSFVWRDVLGVMEHIGDMTMFSMNKNVTMPIVLANLEVDWDWNCLSCTIPIKLILENPNEPWNWNRVSSRSDLTIDMVENHPEVNWHMLPIVIANYDKDKEKYVMAMMRQHFRGNFFQPILAHYLHIDNVQKWLDDGHEMMSLCEKM